MNLRIEAVPRPALEFYISAHVVSETNLRGHWRAHHKRRSGHRSGAKALTALVLRRGFPAHGLVPALVTLTRIRGPRGRALDDDNLAAGFKAIRDGVADALRVDDGDKAQVRWAYAEEKGTEWAVRVRIEKREP